MRWKEGNIDGVSVKPFAVFSDSRGWLAEVFRSDECSSELYPEMGYVSVTEANISRGPHEHEFQTDCFAFFHGHFRLYLWDTRIDSKTKDSRLVLDVGEANRVIVIVPPGVVHAYHNLGPDAAYVMNFPNKLYAGKDKSEQVDEIRHEEDPTSPFLME